MVSSLNYLNGWRVVVCSIKGSVTKWIYRYSEGGTVGAILAGCDIFWIHCTVRTETNIFSLHVFNGVGTFMTKSASSQESVCFNSSLSRKIFATHRYTAKFPPNYRMSTLTYPIIFLIQCITVKWYPSSSWAHLCTITILPVYSTTSCTALHLHIQ